MAPVTLAFLCKNVDKWKLNSMLEFSSSKFVSESSWSILSVRSAAVGESSNPNRSMPPIFVAADKFFFILFFFQSMHNLNVCCFSSSEMASKLLFITPGFMPLGLHNRFDCKTGLGGTEKLSLVHENGSLDAKCITDVSPDINRKNFPWNGVIPIRQNCFISSEYRICLWFSALKSLTTSRNNRYDICFGLNVF